MKIKKCKNCTLELPYSERNGIKTYNAKYGFGIDCGCYAQWCISTKEGKEHLDRFLKSHKKSYERKVKEKWTKEKVLLKEKIETKSSVEKKLQKEINLIVRLIDKGHECISSGRKLGKSFDAGHLYTTGAHPTIRFNLFNIFAQSVHDNQHKSGNELEYFMRLETVFSKELQDFVLSLKHIESIHLSKDEIKDKIDIARSLIKWLKLQDRKFTNEERITLRNDFNNMLAIYDQKYSEFKN